MEKLQELLFKKTAAALETYQRNKADEPEADWKLDRRTFCALYGLIKEAGLEAEYENWKYGEG